MSEHLQKDLEVSRNSSNNKIKKYSMGDCVKSLVNSNSGDEAKKLYKMCKRFCGDKSLIYIVHHTVRKLGSPMDALDKLEWIFSKLKHTIELQDAINALFTCSVKKDDGYDKISTYLKETFNLTKSTLQETYETYNTMLICAVKCQNINTIKWLHKTYTITKEDLRVNSIDVRSSTKPVETWLREEVLEKDGAVVLSSEDTGAVVVERECKRCLLCNKTVYDETSFVFANGLYCTECQILTSNESVSTSSRNNLSQDDDVQCCICMERDKDCVILECGHICSCYKCGVKLTTCPVCRGKVTRVVKVYVA